MKAAASSSVLRRLRRAHRQAERVGQLMHRRLALLLAAAGGLGRARIDGDHVVAGIDQRLRARARRIPRCRETQSSSPHLIGSRIAAELGMRPQWTPIPPRPARGLSPISPRAEPRARSAPIPCRKRSWLRLQAVHEQLAAMAARAGRSRASGAAWPRRGPRSRRSRPARPLHLGTGRPRQVDADGSVLRRCAGREEAPRALPRIHARGARSPAPPARGAGRQGRAAGGRHDRADRQGDRRRRRGCSASTSSRSPTSPTR